MKIIVLLFLIPFASLNGERTAGTPAIFVNTIAIKKDAKKLAEYYRMRALRGESMSSLAKLYSEDPGVNSNGGRYNNVQKGTLNETFEKVVFSLKPNDISEVFETEFGFHFVQLVSRKGDTISFWHLLITRD